MTTNRKQTYIFFWPYLVNRARWLDHYYKTKCVITGEDLEKIDWIKFKMAAYRPLFTFTWQIFGEPC